MCCCMGLFLFRCKNWLAFPSVELHEVLLNSIVQPVQVPLNGSTPIFGYRWWPCGRVQGSNSQQSFDGVLDPKFHAVNVPRQQDRLADGGLCPLQKGVTCYCHSLIPPVLLHGSISMDALMGRVPNPSSLTWVLNLFCSCRSTGETEALPLLLGATSFQPLPSWESAFPKQMGTDSACLEAPLLCAESQRRSIWSLSHHL